MSALVVGIILCAVVLGSAGLLIFFKVKSLPTYNWLDLGTPNVKYIAPVGVPASKLQACYEKAVELLGTTAFGATAAAALSASTVFIVVMDMDSWTDASGRTVGGELQVGSLLQVDKELTSLFHELVHLVELRVDGVSDDLHTHWAARGIWTADNIYRLVKAS